MRSKASPRPLKLTLAAALAALVLVVLAGPASAATPDSEQVKLTASRGRLVL